MCVSATNPNIYPIYDRFRGQTQEAASDGPFALVDQNIRKCFPRDEKVELWDIPTIRGKLVDVECGITSDTQGGDMIWEVYSVTVLE